MNKIISSWVTHLIEIIFMISEYLELTLTFHDWENENVVFFKLVPIETNKFYLV